MFWGDGALLLFTRRCCYIVWRQERNQHWACFRSLFEAHGRFTPCKWRLIRCIKIILFRRIPQSTIKVHTIFSSDESSNASQIQLYNNTPQTEKRPVLASPHPHQKANLRKADDQVTWCHVFLIRGFLFHGLICKLIYRFIDFPTEPDGMPKKVQFWVPPAENQLGVQETPGKIRRWSDLVAKDTFFAAW